MGIFSTGDHQHPEYKNGVFSTPHGDIANSPKLVSDSGKEVEGHKNLGCSPDLRERRKRSFSPDQGTQLGSLTKHSTAIKNNPQARKRLNQTYFVRGSLQNSTLTLSTPDLRTPESRERKKTRVPRRRLNDGNKQPLIDSIFSPRNAEKLSQTRKEEEDEMPTDNVEEDEHLHLHYEEDKDQEC